MYNRNIVRARYILHSPRCLARREIGQTDRMSPRTVRRRVAVVRPSYRYNIIIILLWEPRVCGHGRSGHLYTHYRSTAAAKIVVVAFPTSSRTPFENNNYTRVQAVRHVHKVAAPRTLSDRLRNTTE